LNKLIQNQTNSNLDYWKGHNSGFVLSFPEERFCSLSRWWS